MEGQIAKKKRKRKTIISWQKAGGVFKDFIELGEGHGGGHVGPKTSLQINSA